MFQVKKKKDITSQNDMGGKVGSVQAGRRMGCLGVNKDTEWFGKEWKSCKIHQNNKNNNNFNKFFFYTGQNLSAVKWCCAQKKERKKKLMKNSGDDKNNAQSLF